MPATHPRLNGALGAGFAIALSFNTSAAGAATFNLFYDDFDDGVLALGDIIGTGTFSYDGPIQEGDFLLSELTGVSFEAEFQGLTDTAVFSGPPFDPANDALIGISVTEVGAGVFELVFTGEGATTNGSLDIDNGFGLLSHVPSPLLTPAQGPAAYFGDDFQADFSALGDYIGTTATVIPVPPALYLFGSALAGLMLRRRQG